MYAEVDLIVEGALEESETFGDETLMAHRIAEWDEELRGDGYPGEVFVVWHDHAPGECECVQYLQDGKPYAVIGKS